MGESLDGKEAGRPAAAPDERDLQTRAEGQRRGGRAREDIRVNASMGLRGWPVGSANADLRWIDGVYHDRRRLRAAQLRAEATWTRFETPAGLQSDWGQQRVVRRIFVLTLWYSRRSVYIPGLGETLGDFLDAHEQAFAYFGGHTHAHLYDRPRTVCAPTEAGRVHWNTTFKAFADF